MGIMQALIGAAAVAAGFKVKNSLRLRASASAYLTRTYGAPTNTNIWVAAFWMKKAVTAVTIQQNILVTGADLYGIRVPPAGADTLQLLSGGSAVFTTTAVFRDPTAHYHVVVSCNGTNITITVNGVLVGTYAGTIPGVNAASTYRIGARQDTASGPFDGYFSDFYFVDGQVKVATDFGEFNASGVWVPKAYTGTYGNNGFHLKFEDASAATAAAIGKDTSGNANNWTPTNISVTAGVDFDQMTDTPTNNFATYASNQIASPAATALTKANLKNVSASAAFLNAVGTVAITSGMPKLYWEVTQQTTGSGSSATAAGVIKASAVVAGRVETNANFNGCYLGTSLQVCTAGVLGPAIGAAVTAGEIIGFALDPATRQMWINRGGAWLGTGTSFNGDPAAGVNPAITLPAGFDWLACTHAFANGLDLNHGQRPFTNTPPTGFKTLCTDNIGITTPVASGSFTGNGAADGPVVWTGGVPTTLSIDGSANLIGTANVDKLAGGFKLRSATNNAVGTRNWTATYASPSTNSSFGQPQPAQKNP